MGNEEKPRCADISCAVTFLSPLAAISARRYRIELLLSPRFRGNHRECGQLTLLMKSLFRAVDSRIRYSIEKRTHSIRGIRILAKRELMQIETLHSGILSCNVQIQHLYTM